MPRPHQTAFLSTASCRTTQLIGDIDGIVFVGITDGVAVFELVAGSFTVVCR